MEVRREENYLSTQRDGGEESSIGSMAGRLRFIGRTFKKCHGDTQVKKNKLFSFLMSETSQKCIFQHQSNPQMMAVLANVVTVTS